MVCMKKGGVEGQDGFLDSFVGVILLKRRNSIPSSSKGRRVEKSSIPVTLYELVYPIFEHPKVTFVSQDKTKIRGKMGFKIL